MSLLFGSRVFNKLLGSDSSQKSPLGEENEKLHNFSSFKPTNIVPTTNYNVNINVTNVHSTTSTAQAIRERTTEKSEQPERERTGPSFLSNKSPNFHSSFLLSRKYLLSILLSTNTDINKLKLTEVRPFFVKTLLINKEQLANTIKNNTSVSTPNLRLKEAFPYSISALVPPPASLPLRNSGYQEELLDFKDKEVITPKDVKMKDLSTPNLSPNPNSLLLEQIQERDWNQEFNDVLESPLTERGTKLHQLSLEFVEVATKIGKIIVEERNLSHFQKSLPPIFTNGVAGGEKFKVKGIFFKYAVNKNKLFESDEQAMKIAGHELRGHTALVSCGMMHGLKLGLMTLIDYRGFRLTATSSLPINDSTLVYGSSDGGNNVVSRLNIMSDVMKNCAKVLNLKGHFAGIRSDSRQFMYGPCDLEGHLGKDGKLYVIDLARLFPPETPDRKTPGSFLYKLLRPELVKRFSVPLSSDAFTLFGEDNQQEHDSEVRAATNYLHNTIIPEFARLLDQDHCNIENKPTQWFIDEAHRSGINIRYLGMIRSLVKNEKIRSILLSEIASRVLKNKFKNQLRECKATHDFHYLSVILNFFNSVFVNDDNNNTNNNSNNINCNNIFNNCKSNNYKVWEEVKKAIPTSFENTLSEEENSSSFDIRFKIDRNLVYQRIQDLTGVKMTSSPSFHRYFMESEITGIYAKSKYMYAIPRIEADTAAELARSTNDRVEVKRLLHVAFEKYNSALSLKPDDHVVLSSLFSSFILFRSVLLTKVKKKDQGLVLSQLAMLEEDQVKQKELFALVHEKFSLSIKVKADDFRSLSMWAEALIANSLCVKDKSYLKKALELSVKAEAISTGSGSLNIARVCSLQGKFDLCQKWLSKSVRSTHLPSASSLEVDPSFLPVVANPFFQKFLEQSKKAHC